MALALIESRGRWLVSRRAGGRVFAGLWEFPGGKVETAESPAEAARREAREEVGLEVEVQGPMGHVETAHGGRSVCLHLLHCRVVGGEARPEQPSVETVRWATLAELEKLAMPPANREILALLRDKQPEG